nr:ethylene-responsive transcription factor ERF113-like [Aegilops tauschii subsp. strangulata]
MPPRRREASGYRIVRARPSGAFSAEIRSGEMRLDLGTFDSAHEAAYAYDAAAWRLRRPRREMNFPEVATREQAQELAPPPRLSPTRTVTTTGGGSASSASLRWTRRPWRCGANASRKTSSMSANSTRKGGRRGQQREGGEEGGANRLSRG